MTRPFPTWIAVDPGGRHTGIVEATPTGRYAWHDVIHRDDGEHVISYAQRIKATVAARASLTAGPVRWAIEDVVPIVPHVHDRPIDPSHLVDTGIVLGAVAAWMIDPWIIRPAGHGSNPLATYPEALVTPGERRRKGWELRVSKSAQIRHARSAWDVLCAARHAARGIAGIAVERRTHGLGVA